MNPIWYNAIVASSIGSGYLLQDEFTTPDSAPLTNPRACEPGPGILVPVESSGSNAIVDGKLTMSGASVSYNDPSVYTQASYARVTGLAFKASVTFTSAHNAAYGVDNNNSDINTGVIYGIAGNRLRVGGLIVDDSFAAGTYVTYLIARPSGMLYVVDNSLVYVTNTISIADLYMGAGVLTGANLQFDYWRIKELPAPWNIDYGIATNRIASPAAGTVTVSEIDSIVNVTITAATGVTQELDVRRTDNDNRWIVRMSQAGSTIKLIKREAGAEVEHHSAAQTWVNGVSYRIVAIQKGDVIRTYVADVAKNISITATFNNTATGVKISHAASNLVTWPRTLSGAALATLQAI